MLVPRIPLKPAQVQQRPSTGAGMQLAATSTLPSPRSRRAAELQTHRPASKVPLDTVPKDDAPPGSADTGYHSVAAVTLIWVPACVFA